MNLLFFCLGLLQCSLLWILGRNGMALAARAVTERQVVAAMPPNLWPPCAMIVPTAGAHPNMESALRSLAEQNYPDFTLYLVTGTASDPACPLIERLRLQYPGIRHVIAGPAVACGQKNQNQLAGVAAAGDSAEIYAFCDSTHVAQPDFLRCLTAPIARNEAAFTTGYHEVAPGDQGIASLAYALCAMFMRFIQAVPALTQPWGGAMAMSRRAFYRAEVSQLWEQNVVDDCSLAAMLQSDGIPVRLCPAALLETFVVNHPFAVWRAWLERQILFLKFCIPLQWILLGVAAFVMLAPALWGFWACLRGLLGMGGGTAPFLALCLLCLLGWVLNGWRFLLPGRPPVSRWLVAYFCASAMFAFVYLGTIGARTLIWHDTIYRVGKGGRVSAIEKQ